MKSRVKVRAVKRQRAFAYFYGDNYKKGKLEVCRNGLYSIFRKPMGGDLGINYIEVEIRPIQKKRKAK